MYHISMWKNVRKPNNLIAFKIQFYSVIFRNDLEIHGVLWKDLEHSLML